MHFDDMGPLCVMCDARKMRPEHAVASLLSTMLAHPECGSDILGSLCENHRRAYDDVERNVAGERS
jgi:hypothetical protein